MNKLLISAFAACLAIAVPTALLAADEHHGQSGSVDTARRAGPKQPRFSRRPRITRWISTRLVEQQVLQRPHHPRCWRNERRDGNDASHLSPPYDRPITRQTSPDMSRGTFAPRSIFPAFTRISLRRMHSATAIIMARQAMRIAVGATAIISRANIGRETTGSTIT